MSFITTVLFLLSFSIVEGRFAGLDFGEYCLDDSGQLKKPAPHPAMYYWNVHETNLLMSCPPTTVWYHRECSCMTIEEIEEEEPEDIEEFKKRIEKGFIEAPVPTKAGLSGANYKLLMNFDKRRLADDSANHAYVQRRKNVRVTRRREGLNGEAAKFRNGYLKIPMFNNFRWGSEFSVALWIKPDLSQNGFYGVMDNAAVACRLPSTYFIELGKQSPAGIEIYVGIRTHQKLATLITYLPSQMIANKWIHLAVVFDGELAELFVNGKLRTKELVYGDVLSRPCPFTIGYSRGLRRTLKFRGLMDQIYVMKYVLTREEVRELYTTKKVITAA